MVDLKSGIVSTIAGNGKKGVPKGRKGGRRSLVDPRALRRSEGGMFMSLNEAATRSESSMALEKIRTIVGTGEKAPAATAAMHSRPR